MKKLLALVAGIMFLAGGSLMAENIAFSYGTNFFSPSDSGLLTNTGITTMLEWNMGDGMTLAVVNEQTVLESAASNDGLLTVRGIRITQSVINRVRIGLGLGSGIVAPGATGLGVENEAVVDILGEVELFESSSDTVSGSLVATVGARYMRAPNSTPLTDNLNGSNMGLAVKLGF